MPHLYLMRHAEPEIPGTGKWFVGKRSDWPLSEVGHAHAKKAAETLIPLGIEVIYTSTLQRAIQTAEPTAEALGLPIHTDERLCETDLGEFDGHSHAEIREIWPEEFYLRYGDMMNNPPVGGETAAQLVDRALPAIREIRARHPGKNILIVGHTGMISAVLNRLGRKRADGPISYCAVHDLEAEREDEWNIYT